MKRTFKIVLIVLSFVLFYGYVNAQNDVSVSAKYNYQKGNNFYKKTIVSKDAYFSEEKIKISTTSNKDDGIDVLLIPASGETLNWISKITDDYISNVKGYYVQLLNDDIVTEPNGMITFYCDCENDFVYMNINPKGEIINRSSNNSSSLNILNNCYVAFGTSKDLKKDETGNTINIKIGTGGSIVIDGNSFDDNYTYKYENDSLNLIITPDFNYIIDKVYADSIDITSEVVGGFLTITGKVSDLNITFKKDVDNNLNKKMYSITGTILKNGVPVSGALVELHSNFATTYTDLEGKFKFYDVLLGRHSIKVVDNNKVIGYSEFVLDESNNNELAIAKRDGIDNILVNGQNLEIKIIVDIKDDYKIELKDAEYINDDVIDDNKTDDKKDDILNCKGLCCISFINISLCIWIIILLFAFALIIFTVKKSTKK